MNISESRIRVRYAETDQMGIVYYANYIVWMEVGRVDFCKSVGFNYREMEIEDGILLAVVEAQCRYLSPARFDDEVIIRTRIAESNTRMIRFAYEMFEAGEQRKLAEGSTKHIFLSPQLRPVRLPEKYHESFELR